MDLQMSTASITLCLRNPTSSSATTSSFSKQGDLFPVLSGQVSEPLKYKLSQMGLNWPSWQRWHEKAEYKVAPYPWW